MIVRKLLVFDFEIATGSGTNYQRSWYDDRFGKALMENMGTPVSIFFKYNYLRSKSDWEDAINAGDNLLGNFEKKLDFNTSAKLDADTVLVLVDPNDGGKPYYARYGDVFGNGTNGTFSLSSFKENLDGTGASFKSVSLCDLLDLRYVSDPSGLFVEDVQANATVKAKNSSGSVEAYFRLKSEIDTGPYYSISVNKTDESYTYDQNKSSYIVKLDESYYISFFTLKDDVSEKLHRYVFSSPSSIKDPDNPTPTRKVHNSYRERTDNAYLFMGSIFVQSDFAVKELTVNPLMAVDSRPADLDVYMRSTISIASDIYSGIRAYLSAMTDGEYNIKVYQSFILNLTRHESDSVMRKVFIDSAEPSANVRINYASPGHDTGSASDYSVPCTVYPNGSYAEIRYDQPLNSYLVANELACTPAVVETRINIEYDSDDKLREQFPIRNDVEENTKGTTVSGSSNVAYDPARTAYSKSTISGSDPIGKKYYCLLDEKKARLEYNVDIDYYDGDYDPLGINPLDYHDNQLAFSISTRAVYNLDEIYDKTVDYDMIRCTVKLYCKNDPTPYSVALSFPDYMETGSGVYLNNVAGATKSMNPADNYTTLVFTAPRSSILDISRDSTGRALEIPITYTIYTGKSETAGAVTFESQDHVYSNYKIYLEVELYKSSMPTDVLTSSKANDYLIYTNARIIPDFIDELS